MAGFGARTPVISIPLNMARSPTGPGGWPGPWWHELHWVRSFGRVRKYVSLLRPVVLSTVSNTTVEPAASTRSNNCSQASYLLGAYNWYKNGRPNALFTSWIGVELI